ncbi:hypothetical protein [Tychonema sp. BBK16]|uniref:hypothetical protein n=1 Tax=Tychonema sp. BBK16 TaxID=2699888 RepID=UPI001F32371B|nr:hypothetical protein [Tychonema sp. BBK16]MCF6373686.1 hypothetical protein [Tychonema sp. BBK16]
MSNNECNPNITLIYQYAEQALKDLELSSNRLNTKLGVVLGFDAALIRFFSGLPDRSIEVSIDPFDISLECNLCLLLKSLSYLALMISLIYCFLGFKPQTAGKIFLPEELLEKCLDISEEDYKLSIIENWNQSIKELAKNRDKTSDLFKGAICTLIGAAILSAIDVVLSSFLVK